MSRIGLRNNIGKSDIGFFVIGSSDLAVHADSRGRGNARVWPSPDDHKVVGAFLSEVRRETNVTQAELAKRLGKPQSFVSAYERGQRRIDFLEFSRIMSALGRDATTVGADLLEKIDDSTRGSVEP